MPRSMKGWRKRWLFLKNDDSALLPTFFGGHPIPLTSWGEGTIGKDLSWIQTPHENLQQLRQEGLTGIQPMQTFFRRRIQPLWLRKTKMWAYQGSTCPDCPSPEELSAVDEETQIHKVLDSAAVPPPGASPGPLRRGIISVRVGTSGPISATFTILSLHCANDIAQGLGDSYGDTRGTDFSMDATGRAMSCTSNRAMQSREEREREREIGVPLVGRRGNRGRGPLLNLHPPVRRRQISGQLGLPRLSFT
jgi:hypothetical protein